MVVFQGWGLNSESMLDKGSIPSYIPSPFYFIRNNNKTILLGSSLDKLDLNLWRQKAGTYVSKKKCKQWAAVSTIISACRSQGRCITPNYCLLSKSQVTRAREQYLVSKKQSETNGVGWGWERWLSHGSLQPQVTLVAGAPTSSSGHLHTRCASVTQT